MTPSDASETRIVGILHMAGVDRNGDTDKLNEIRL
jgi:hypothetical protein